MQASHDTIAAHRLVVLAEVNTVSQDWGNLFFKLSLAETLEEIATSITEEAWLYNEYAFNICFDYIHCFCFNFCSYYKIFRASHTKTLITRFCLLFFGGRIAKGHSILFFFTFFVPHCSIALHLSSFEKGKRFLEYFFEGLTRISRISRILFRCKQRGFSFGLSMEELRRSR